MNLLRTKVRIENGQKIRIPRGIWSLKPQLPFLFAPNQLKTKLLLKISNEFKIFDFQKNKTCSRSQKKYGFQKS